MANPIKKKPSSTIIGSGGGKAKKHSLMTDLTTSGHPADIITYDNTASGLSAENVQDAIDEVAGNDTNLHADLTDLSTSGHDADIIAYDNSTSGLSATNSQDAIDEVDGLVDTNTSDISALETRVDKLDNDVEITTEPTGFTNSENISMSYDETTRKVTLTGTFQMYYKGELILDITSSSWTSAAHTENPTDPLILFYNDSGYQWSTTAWNFSDAWIALIVYNNDGDFIFSQRETHGFMEWQCHRELHRVIGTYKESGGTLSDYTLNSTTAADRRPDADATVIYDEDLKTTNSAKTDSLYTQYFLKNATGYPDFTEDAADIVPLSTNQPYWNEYTGSTWQQTLMTNNQYMCIWQIGIPTGSDTQSQKYRYIYMQGQSEGTLSEQEALTPADLYFGEDVDIRFEFVFLNKIIIQYTAANWKLISVTALTGSRYSQSSVPSLQTYRTSHICRWGLDDFTVTSGTWEWYEWTEQLGAGFLWNGITGNLNDEITYNDIWIEPGFYTIRILGARGSNGGIATVYLDGSSIGTYDGYNATDQYNYTFEFTNVEVESSGLHTLGFKMTNTSNTDYTVLITKIEIWRTN